MINWITDQVIERKLKLSESEKQELMYPLHLARRMQVSSMVFGVNSWTCFYFGYLDLAVVALVACIGSLNHWRFPVFGIRRSVDLVIGQCAAVYHLYTAYFGLTAPQWAVGVYVGFTGFLLFYGGAICFGVNGHTEYASRFHVTMHLWGGAFNTYLYLCIRQNSLE